MDARSLHIGAAIAVFTAAAGFVFGIRGTRSDTARVVSAPRPAVSAVGSARGYADERANRYGPNAGMYDGVFDTAAAFDLVAPPLQSEADRAAAVAKRASRRAYDGAPPTIPHRINQMGPPDCTACHQTGLRIGSLLAPKMSHALHSSCTQCHVVKVDPRPDAPKVAEPESVWEGLTSWGKGSRAWPGAPPTIPHPTAMRTDCMSCHGPFGTVGLKTPHPYRQSCTQCHVADAEKDQHPAQNLGPGGALP